jgi:hypothetical protein
MYIPDLEKLVLSVCTKGMIDLKMRTGKYWSKEWKKNKIEKKKIHLTLANLESLPRE